MTFQQTQYLKKSILAICSTYTNKINELCDIINTIQKEREAERFEIQEWIGILEAVRKSVNIHEKQIDELQMKLEPEKCETPADPYEEQRKWIGKLCRFRDKDYKDDQWDYGLLQAVEKAETAHVWKTGCFKHNLGHWYDFCEPVKPDDDIIYKGGKHEAPAENVQQISYMAPGDITVFHGFNSSVEFDTPLPYGTRITIKSITKGGDNE